MKLIDFCRNSLTLTLEEQNYANQRYNNLVSHIYKLAIQSPIILNIYIGGSLALGEPSLTSFNAKVIGLHSDIDFFIMVQNYIDIPKTIELVKSIEDIEVDISRSLHAVPAFKIPENLCFPSIDDLLCGIKHPVLEKFDISNMIPELSRNPRTMANFFVSRTAATLLPHYITSHRYSNLKNNKQQINNLDKLKMIFAGLRVQFYGIVDNMHGVNDIAKLVPSGMFDTILDRVLIMDLLTIREKYDETVTLPEVNYYEFYRNVWINKLQLDSNVLDVDIINIVVKTFFNYSLVLDYLLGLLTLLNFVVLSKNNILYSNVITYLSNGHKYQLSVEILQIQVKLESFLHSNLYIQDELLLILMEVHRLTLQEHSKMLTAD